MEVQNLSQLNTLKADEAKKAQLPLRPISNAYRKITAESDQVEVSGKGKLLLSLRESYNKLDTPSTAEQLQNIQKKLEDGKSLNLNSEEIVSSILRGTLFQVI